MKNLNILRFLGKYPNPIAQKASYDSSNSYADKDSKYNKLNTKGIEVAKSLNPAVPYLAALFSFKN